MRGHKRNPRGKAIETILLLGIVGGAGYLGYKLLKDNTGNITNKTYNLLAGQAFYNTNGTANPKAAPWINDTGYSVSRY